MPIVTLDFESYYDRASGYTLKAKGMTTEAYVRDPRFRAHMIGVKVDDGPTEIYDPAFLHNNRDFRQMLAASTAIAQHAQFDGLILARHFNVRPRFWCCTMAMGRYLLRTLRSHSLDALASHFNLPAKTVPYNLFEGIRDLGLPEHGAIYDQVAAGCTHDVDLTWAIARWMLPRMPQDELKIIDIVIRMFTEPALLLDVPRAEAFLREERLRKGRTMLAAGAAMGLVLPAPLDAAALKAYLWDVEVELQSSAKFALALGAIGHACPTKWSEKQEKEIPALAKSDDGMKELLEHDDPRVQALAAARLGVKSTIDESRAATLLGAASRGPLTIYLAPGAAKTLRFGGGDSCLTDDTMVKVFDFQKGYTTKRIVDILPDDLVWDGEAFVAHDGVAFQGYQEVTEHDGVEGTADHRVFVEGGEPIGLAEAQRRGARIMDCKPPPGWTVDGD